MNTDECRRRFAGARRAYLATSGDDRWPHLVPVVFAVSGDVVVTAVDAKPKRTTALRRLRNIGENPRVCFLVDSYDEDWDRLWWVRADARASILDGGPARDAAVASLRDKYEQYATHAPGGPVIRADVVRWSGWSSSSPG